MKKTEVLKDGSKVEIRSLVRADLDRLMDFFRSLPEIDRKYLRVDVTDKDVVDQRLKRIKTGELVRIIARLGDEIIADGALEQLLALDVPGWLEEMGLIREHFARFGDKLPAELAAYADLLEARLKAASADAELRSRVPAGAAG